MTEPDLQPKRRHCNDRLGHPHRDDSSLEPGSDATAPATDYARGSPPDCSRSTRASGPTESRAAARVSRKPCLREKPRLDDSRSLRIPVVEARVVEALLERFESVLSPEVALAFGDRQQPKDPSMAPLPVAHLELGAVRYGCDTNR